MRKVVIIIETSIIIIICTKIIIIIIIINNYHNSSRIIKIKGTIITIIMQIIVFNKKMLTIKIIRILEGKFSNKIRITSIFNPFKLRINSNCSCNNNSPPFS
jgi:hypothetical protein